MPNLLVLDFDGTLVTPDTYADLYVRFGERADQNQVFQYMTAQLQKLKYQLVNHIAMHNLIIKTLEDGHYVAIASCNPYPGAIKAVLAYMSLSQELIEKSIKIEAFLPFDLNRHGKKKHIQRLLDHFAQKGAEIYRTVLIDNDKAYINNLAETKGRAEIYPILAPTPEQLAETEAKTKKTHPYINRAAILLSGKDITTALALLQLQKTSQNESPKILTQFVNKTKTLPEGKKPCMRSLNLDDERPDSKRQKVSRTLDLA